MKKGISNIWVCRENDNIYQCDYDSNRNVFSVLVIKKGIKKEALFKPFYIPKDNKIHPQDLERSYYIAEQFEKVIDES